MPIKNKKMLTVIIIWFVLSILAAVSLGVIKLMEFYAKQKSDATGAARHQEVIGEISDIKETVGNLKNDESLESQLRKDYPYGYILYGYQNGITSFVPIAPLGEVKITCSTDSMTLGRDSVSGKFILTVHQLQYYRDAGNPLTINIRSFEWKFPADDTHPYETRLVEDGGRLFSAIVELIKNDDDKYVFVLAFLVRPSDEVQKQIHDNGVIGTPGFYTRRLTRLKAKADGKDNEEVGKALINLGDALCQQGKFEAGIDNQRHGVQMLERLNSNFLDVAYANYAWHLEHAQDHEAAIVFARKSKALHGNRSAVDDSTQISINSTLALALYKTGKRRDGIPLLKDNLKALLVKYYTDAEMTRDFQIAAQNWIGAVSLDPVTMEDVERMGREMEKEAYKRVHGNLDGYAPLLEFNVNPDFRGFDK